MYNVPFECDEFHHQISIYGYFICLHLIFVVKTNITEILTTSHNNIFGSTVQEISLTYVIHTTASECGSNRRLPMSRNMSLTIRSNLD